MVRYETAVFLLVWMVYQALQVALTYAVPIIVALAAQQAGCPDLVRSLKQVLAHLWERDLEL